MEKARQKLSAKLSKLKKGTRGDCFLFTSSYIQMQSSCLKR